MVRKKFSHSDYNKNEPSKDATKYFIIYEGTDKEPKYFEAFNKAFLDSKSAYVHHVLEDDTKVYGSNPRKLKERAESFINTPPKDLQFTPESDDRFRFVLDVDSHPATQISELRVYCTSMKDSQLYISNFCFEVWLWAHLDELNNIQSTKSKDLKTELHQKLHSLKEGSYPSCYMDVKKIRLAIDRCEKSDLDNVGNYFPKEKNSKLYQLIKELLNHSFLNLSTTIG